MMRPFLCIVFGLSVGIATGSPAWGFAALSGLGALVAALGKIKII